MFGFSRSKLRMFLISGIDMQTEAQNLSSSSTNKERKLTMWFTMEPGVFNKKS